MAKLENTIECVETLMDLMNKKGMGKLAYTCDDFEIVLEAPEQAAPVAPVFPIPAAPAVASSTEKCPEKTAPKCEEVKGNIIKSPIVGTYYNSPAPGKPPFVTVGQTVKKGDVLMIIESMKLMNEIQSEFDGTVAEIMVCDGEAVDFEQPLMRIE